MSNDKSPSGINFYTNDHNDSQFDAEEIIYPVPSPAQPSKAIKLQPISRNHNLSSRHSPSTSLEGKFEVPKRRIGNSIYSQNGIRMLHSQAHSSKNSDREAEHKGEPERMFKGKAWNSSLEKSNLSFG